MNSAFSEINDLDVVEVSSIPSEAPRGRCLGAYSGLSSRIRALQTGSGLEFPAPDKAKERSLRSLAASIGKSTGCYYTVRLSANRATIGVYRLR